MKDPRIDQLAKTLINYSVELKPGENILIESIGSELPLVKALIKETFLAGGVPFLTIKNNELLRELLKGCSVEQIKRMASFEVARMKEMKAY
jgi:aminopeptidase